MERTMVPIVWTDRVTCEPASGQWRDRYLDASVSLASEIDALSLIPAPVVHSSGGWQWDRRTRSAFMADDYAPATTVVTANSGHNPRSSGPADWRPAREEAWCAYAVDWVEVKGRWNLGVDADERRALEEMLATCDQSMSDGPDVDTVELRPGQPPEISFS